MKRAFSGEDYLLVDGYNIIFAWDELKKLAAEHLDAARKKLCDLLCNYQGYRKCRVILVFDAYKVKGGLGSVEKYHNITIVYTKEAETADAYIERATYEIGRQHGSGWPPPTGRSRSSFWATERCDCRPPLSTRK